MVYWLVSKDCDINRMADDLRTPRFTYLCKLIVQREPAHRCVFVQE